MKKILLVSLLTTASFTSAFAESQQEDHGHHHHHGASNVSNPLSIMGDHVHSQGEWMINVSTMTMRMGGLRKGNSKAEIADAHANHNVAPLDMDMDMTMLGVMYGLTDDTTLRFMASHITKEMNHQMQNGNRFRRESSGLGDLKVGANHRLLDTENSILVGGLALSLPTGSINASDDNGVHLPYPMQLGSGTYDLIPTLTYAEQKGDMSWGVQAQATFRTGRNDYGYRLGHEYTVREFAGYAVNEKVSLTGELAYKYRENIQGRNTRTMNPGMVPTADPDQQARSEVSAKLGAVYQTEGPAQVAFEVGLPLYQNLKGVQLENDWSANLVWRFSF